VLRIGNINDHYCMAETHGLDQIVRNNVRHAAERAWELVDELCVWRIVCERREPLDAAARGLDEDRAFRSPAGFLRINLAVASGRRIEVVGGKASQV
jgi:hypothetical protein